MSRAARLASGIALSAAACAPSHFRFEPARHEWPALPTQAPATEGIAALPGGARLYYWDTGGPGEPVVLLHASSGSAASWAYQQPVLAAAGYRVIGYSRRGAYRSDPPDSASPGTAATDLDQLADFLKLGRFHLVSTGGGGGVALAYAISHQERLRSLTVANSLGGIQQPELDSIQRALLPNAFSNLPFDFQELGPNYRAANRGGVEEWLAQHRIAGRARRQGREARAVTWASLATLHVPTLLITGDADLYMPPITMRIMADHIPGSEAVVIAEVGHSGHWEQPEVFNRTLLSFLRRHRSR